MRLNHVTLPARDVQASAHFYTRLGLTQIVDSYPDYARFLSPEGDVTLSLHRAEQPPSAASVHFEVDDVDQAITALAEKGFEIESEPADQPYLWREATLLDPDGNRIFIYRAGEMRLNPPWRLPSHSEGDGPGGPFRAQEAQPASTRVITEPRRNIELKARDADPTRSLEVCEALGAADQGVLVQRDTYFEVPRGRLKLREEEGAPSQLISYARPDEASERLSCYRLVDIADTAGLKAALSQSLGTKIVVSKRRRLFSWRDVRIHLDRVDGLGAFLEFEAVAPEHSDLSHEHGKVRRLREAFAIESEDLIDCSYSDLLLKAG